MTREDALIIAQTIAPVDQRFKLTSLTRDDEGMWIAAYTNAEPDPMEVIIERWPDEDADEDEPTDATDKTDVTETIE